VTHYIGRWRSVIDLVFQIEGSSLALLNSDTLKTGENPVLEIDESDNEIEFKLQPNVIRVVKHRSLPAPITSHSAKKVKTEAGKEVSKRKVVRCRPLSTSMLSPFVNKIKGKGRKDGSKRKVQPCVTPVMKRMLLC
jgi:hypothetical protein